MHLQQNKDSHGGQHPDGGGRLEWWAVVALSVVALGLGTVAFMQSVDEQGKPWGFWDALYDSMRLFHMHFDHVPRPLPWELQVARFLAPLLVAVTLAKGFLFAARNRHHAIIHRSKDGHVVICGLSRKGLELARHYRRRKRWVIVIEKDPQNSLLATCDSEGIFYWIGDASEPAVLEKARVAHAREIIIVAPEDETNLRIAMLVREVAATDVSIRKECFVQIENIHLRERLQRLFGDECGDGRKCCALRFFDVYDSEARRVLLDLPLDGPGIAPGDSHQVHMVLLGFGRMGRSLALRAAKLGVFANHRKLRISVLDRCAEQQREHFLFRYPVMEGDAICETKFFHAEAESLTARQLIAEWAAEPGALLHIFICLDDNAKAVEVVLRLQEMLAGNTKCNLCVRIKSRGSLGTLFKSEPGRGPHMRAFGMVEETSYYDAFVPDSSEYMARRTHDAFVEKRLADSNRTPGNDPALRRWNELTEDLRESNRTQTDHISIKLRAIGCAVVPMSDLRPAITHFDPADLEILAELEHRRWNTERLLAGWRYGQESDKMRRINRNLIEWDQLTAEVKQYDREAVEEIPDRLASAVQPMKAVRIGRLPDDQ